MDMTGKEAIDKKLQRKLALERRRALTQEEREEKSRASCDLLIKLIKDPRYSEVRTIFSYRGTWDEVNVDAGPRDRAIASLIRSPSLTA